MKHIFLFIILLITLSSCSENYSNGERIGLITQFSKAGIIWKTWEGHLNMTQTGMNSSTPFDFSIDNDISDETVINTVDSAAQHGWKVKLIYHETMGKNWFGNRGETNHFISKCEVLDKSPIANAFNNHNTQSATIGTHDTIYVLVVSKDQLKNK